MDEFVRLPIQEVGKRNVILPFSFFMGIKNELHILSGTEPVVQNYSISRYIILINMKQIWTKQSLNLVTKIS